VSGGILTIASAQDLLSATPTEGAELGELVHALVAMLALELSSLDVEGLVVKLPVDATMPMALVLQERATNALKYRA
jgi:two-component sensor histidine kinase